MTEPEPVPADDAIAAAISDALTRTVADEPSASIAWTAVVSRARRVVRVRRTLAASVCAAVVLGATGVAMAASSGGTPSDISVVAPPTTNVNTATTTSTLPPLDDVRSVDHDHVTEHDDVNKHAPDRAGTTRHRSPPPAGPARRLHGPGRSLGRQLRPVHSGRQQERPADDQEHD